MSRLNKYDKKHTMRAADKMVAFLDCGDPNIEFKAAKEILDYDHKVESFILDRDKYEKPATQKIEHEIRGIKITFESPDSK